MLTDVQIRRLKGRHKQFKLADARGLYVLVTPAGSKLWRLKYRMGGREKLLALGAYPDVPLAAAREKCDAARKLIAAGIDPSEQRKAQRRAKADSFREVALEWFEKKKARWTPGHQRTVILRLQRHLFPFVGSRPMTDITALEVLSVLRKIESRGTHETAHRVRGICSDVFRYAIASGRADRDPSADLRGALTSVQTRHQAAITEPDKAAALLRMLDGYRGTPPVEAALKLAPLVFVRPGELRHAEWSEIDLDRGQWIIPASRTKMRHPHQVPLSRQAVTILSDLQRITGDGRYVFPSGRGPSRPMSDNAILSAMRRMGIAKDEMTGHGFRAMARTILDEVLHFRVDLIEHQLAHAVKDPNGRAYNRTSFLVERGEMMQKWADYLDGLKAGGEGASK